MSQRKKTALVNKKEPARLVSFQLSLSGIAGIAVVMFCLFLWMFLIGVWAGQTILFPSSPPAASESKDNVSGSVLADTSSVEILLPQERKKRIAPSILEQPSVVVP